ncbi:MAG TPA: serine hydrolase domain-containing protein, partial [Flavisolibacter sp.]|nr:serine hydrolase domain-containing protein [Flavisolibacter sp.]
MRLVVFFLALFITQANAQEAFTLKSSIDSLFSRFNNHVSPGCAVAVVNEGKKVFEGFYGMSNLEYDIPIGRHSKFHIASLSKQFTAAAIIRLAQEGKLSLNDDIRKYVQEIPDFGKKITINHLLHHTSGLRDQWVMLSLAGWRDGDLVTEGDIMDIVKKQKTLNFAPGDEFLYSNTGYTILGIAVKRITNISLKDYVDSVFFRPLGMNDTHFQSDHAAIIPGRTSAYYKDNNKWKIAIPVFDNYGATSLFTTVEDLVKWDSLFYSDSATGRLFTKMMYQPGVLNNKMNQIYASGLMLTSISGYDAVEHSGADAAYRSYFMRVPEKRFAVYILSNVDDIDFISASRFIFNLLHKSKPGEKPEGVAGKVSIDSSIVKKWAGTYFDTVTQTIHRINFKDSQLSIGWWGLQALSNYEFSAGPFTKFTFHSDKGKVVMTKEEKGNVNTVYENVENRFRPAGNQEQYKGRYYCSELGTYYHLELTESGFIVNVLRNAPIKCTPFLPDIYEGEYNFVIRFKRDNRGAVSGFYL